MIRIERWRLPAAAAVVWSSPSLPSRQSRCVGDQTFPPRWKVGRRDVGHFSRSPCFRSPFIHGPNLSIYIETHLKTAQLSTFYSGGFQLLRLENPSTATRGLRPARGRTCWYRGNSRAAIWVERPWRRHPGTSLRHARRNLIGTIGRVRNCAWAAWFRSSRIGGGARRARHRRRRGSLRTRRSLRICLS